MVDREYILKLLYAAFIDIRVASHSEDNQTCFVISDVFHTIPLQLNRADKGEIEYADIIKSINQKCEERKCTRWLDNAKENIARLP
ncbi:hypothetical protein [Dictyobacter kobayashii]|uniref:Uncharacterized protein n=1 Tax=Dictyobacter kobayashii TaxID=2014872 RepID=A0A402AF03_9CHLR|nr:hypothetical protein [Dictyobacter kobayashii]GCE17666.1 hypothetical protein KDK_14660 [Dictyobacter kobayashii]